MRIPLIALIGILLGSVLIDLYIYNDIRKNTGRKIWRRLYAFFSLALWIFIIVTLSLPLRDAGESILPVMWMLYSYLTVFASKLVYIFFSVCGRLFRFVVRNDYMAHTFRWVGFICAIAVFLIMWFGIWETRYNIVVERVEIESPKVPVGFDGYRIVQVSDIHVGTWGNDTTFVSMLVDSVNSLKPDLIVFTGDIVNRRTDELLPFVSVLSRLKAPDGVLSVLGNHDYGDYVDWKYPEERIANNRRLAELQKEMGWRLMNNETCIIREGNDSIVVTGVENIGDPPFPTYGDLEMAISSSPDSSINQNDANFKILLTHNPEHWNHYVSQETNIDLTLSGHTHAMQMMLRNGDWKWSPAKWRYEQWGGIYSRPNLSGEETRLYVNIGAGEVGMPARLVSAYPEITLISLHHED